jgi:UDP:flavonoid glycosyltransferase YjiC (YdhE family)
VRILLTSQAPTSHVRAMANAARQLALSGHTVALASPSSTRALVQDTYGVLHFISGQDWTHDGAIGPELADALSHGNRAFVRALLDRSTAAADAMRDMLMATIETTGYDPQIVLRDSTCIGSREAADALNLPSLPLDVGVSEWSDGIGPELRAERATRAAPGSDAPDTLLTPAPAGLILDAAPDVRPYRHEDPARTDERLPRWALDLDPGDPFVYVALGSLLPSGLSDLTLGCYLRIVDALAALDVRALISTGTHNYRQVADRAARNPRIMIVKHAAQPLILRGVATAALLHCGYASVREAVGSAVPIVAMPLTTDQPGNAQRLAAHGIAVTLAPDASADDIASALRCVIAEPSYRHAARRWQRQMLALPTLGNVLAAALSARVGR